METVYLLMGSNLGDRELNLKLCIQALSGIGKTMAVSSVYETKAWGNTEQPDYFNQAIAMQTGETPDNLLLNILGIERQLGRVREEKWGSRIIDIDILLFGSSIVESDKLKVPHPFLPDRRFALTPLAEIAPEIIHPLLDKSIKVLLAECADELQVKKIK